ncbi:MAG: enoyl-CoA hydratase [Caulobacteraceae bacterium]|nr:enoyl-CoA hydratase [Caulobacteraceae bacterium]
MLLIDKQDGVAIVTLNRPEAMNALSKGLRAALAEAFVALQADPDVRAAILTGAGERAFTAGLDLKELGSDPLGMGAANATEPASNPVKAIETFSKPVIGAINGVAITGGFEVALACDVLIASTNARFADTHARVGITPGWGLSQKLSRAIGLYRAKELSLTGNFLDAQTACDWGLVNRVVAPEELLPTAIRLAQDMATIPTDISVFYKSMINDGFDLPFGEALALEHSRSVGWNAKVTPEIVEANRQAVLARGRQQKPS